MEADYENLDLMEATEYQRLMKKIYPDEEALQSVEARNLKSKKNKTSRHVDENDLDELRMWVLNDEGLYNWFIEGLNEDEIDDDEILNSFIYENKEELARLINEVNN